MDDHSPPLPSRFCRLLAVLLIAGTALARLVYLATVSPLDLAPDEAHYWDWSRHLDWSYYSKGPGVAWLIRLSCELFGSLSVRLTGTEMLAVRLPAVVGGSLLLASMYLLTWQVSRRDGPALLVVALALTTPALSAGSSLMTIDSPYCCCWGWALVLAYRAIFKRCKAAWLLCGVVVGIGILFKYTMVLWLPSLALFLQFSREHRHWLASKWFWAMTALAACGWLPIVLWNLQHDWVTFHHVGGLAGLREDVPTIYWLGPLVFLLTQCGLWLVFWFIVWARAMWSHAPGQVTEPPLRFLWWMSLPIFAVFFLFAFKTDGGEANWPVTAYISGFVLGALWMVQELPKATGLYRGVALTGMTTASCVGVLLTVFVHFSSWAHPLLVPLAGEPTQEQPFPLRRLDPTLRLRGWRTLAAEVDRVRDDLRQRGVEPVLAASGWNLPGLLGFYCEGQPVVYSVGLALGDRRSQYDFWRPNPVFDAASFQGQTFLIIAPDAIDLHSAFERVETIRVVRHCEHGQPVASWTILVCHGYRGFGLTRLSSGMKQY